MQYKAPINFRAVRVQNDYVLKADGYEFGVLMAVDGGFQFVTSTGMLREELHMDERPFFVAPYQLARRLAEIKKAYIAQDKYCFEEVENDRLTELRVEQSLEYFAPHAADTDYEDRMGWS